MDTAPGGEQGESTLRAFVKVSSKMIGTNATSICQHFANLGILNTVMQRSALRLRRLSNLLGCRDPEYTSPQPSRSTSSTNPQSDQQDGFEDDTMSSFQENVEEEEELHDEEVSVLI